MWQVTCLGDCDVMKEVSAHFSSISRITGHHVADLPSYLAAVLSPAQLQLALSMLRRMETVAEAAALKVLLHSWCPHGHLGGHKLALTKVLYLGWGVGQRCCLQ